MFLPSWTVQTDSVWGAKLPDHSSERNSIWPLMVFYKLNLALEVYYVGQPWSRQFVWFLRVANRVRSPILLSQRLKWNEKIESQGPKVVSTISGTGATIWSRTNFGPTGQHHSLSSSLPHVCTVPCASAIFWMHTGSRVLWEHSSPLAILPRTSKFYQNVGLPVLYHLSYLKMAAFKFYLQSGKQKMKVSGDDSDAFRKKRKIPD
jgi:hypothetical protein